MSLRTNIINHIVPKSKIIFDIVRSNIKVVGKSGSTLPTINRISRIKSPKY